MLTADSPLVAGAQAPAAARMETVRVVRPFFLGEARHEPGESLSLDWRLVQELVTAQKAERVTDAQAAPAQPTQPAQTAPAQPAPAAAEQAPSLPLDETEGEE